MRTKKMYIVVKVAIRPNKTLQKRFPMDLFSIAGAKAMRHNKNMVGMSILWYVLICIYKSRMDGAPDIRTLAQLMKDLDVRAALVISSACTVGAQTGLLKGFVCPKQIQCLPRHKLQPKRPKRRFRVMHISKTTNSFTRLVMTPVRN